MRKEIEWSEKIDLSNEIINILDFHFNEIIKSSNNLLILFNAFHGIIKIELDRLTDQKNHENLHSISEDIFKIESNIFTNKQLNNSYFYKTHLLEIYTLLEVCIKKIIIALIKKLDFNEHPKELRNIKISLSEFNSFDEDDKIEFLFNNLERNTNGGINYSLDRFENLLKVFGLNGPINKSIKKNILELSQIRNLLLHKDGYVDNHFKKKCPFSKYKNQKKINLDSSDLQKFRNSVYYYILLLKNRFITIMPLDENLFIHDLENEFSEVLDSNTF